MFNVHELCFATINLPPKFEVSNYTHNEDIKGDTKYGKLGRVG